MIIVAAVLMAVAAALALTPNPQLRAAPRERQSGRNLAPIATVIAALGAFVLMEGVLGLVCAGLIILLAPKAFAAIEQRQRAQTDAHLARNVPHIADMLAAALAAGIAIPQATRAVARATGHHALHAVVRAQELGADPIEAWRTAPEALRPIGHAFARSQHTGASVSSVLHGVAEDARRQHRITVEVAARTAGVRAVAPLAACFLPAFLRLGVAPVVVTLADGFFTW